MLFKRILNLLPKKSASGVALKIPAFKIGLVKVRGFNEPKIKVFKFTKLPLAVALVLYLMGYQPTLAIPPIKKSEVLAEFTQEQSIQAASLSQAFSLPHPGYISTHFSAWHPGTDIATGLGMPIHPIAPGKVVEATYSFFGLGHFVVVEHQQGYRSTYGHMGKIFVRTGDNVSPSSILGEVGLTGHTSGPHTHLEITQEGKYIDPEKVLPILPDFPQP